MQVISQLARLAAPCCLLALAGSMAAQQPAPTPSHPWALVLHGGAGVIARSSMTADAEAAYRAGLQEAIAAAGAVLDKGGSSLDAVETAIRLLEDNPLFNAGRGAVFAANGTNQLDAAILDGATLQAGAVADVQRTRHPISLARAVMERSPHVMLIGQGADDFAASMHLEQVPPSFFFTEPRWQQLEKALKQQGVPIPPRPLGAPAPPTKPVAAVESPDAHKYGTVGVVALDRQGNIAAGTSTGGTTAKRWNRVGDTPIIGAGTYASNKSCGVSATGTGEYFIRLTVARTVCALVEYKSMPLQAAADQVVQKELPAIHGDGGIIALTPTASSPGASTHPACFAQACARAAHRISASSRTNPESSPKSRAVNRPSLRPANFQTTYPGLTYTTIVSAVTTIRPASPIEESRTCSS